MPDTSSPGTRSVCPFAPTFMATVRRANIPEKTVAVGAPAATGGVTRRSVPADPASTKLSRKSSYIGYDSMLPPELLP